MLAPAPAHRVEAHTPSHEQLVAAAQRRAISTPASVSPDVPAKNAPWTGKEIAAGAAIGAGGIFAAAAALPVFALWGFSKVFDPIAKSIADGFVKGKNAFFKAINPFRDVWQRWFGGGASRSHHHGHGHVHSGGDAHGPKDHHGH